MVEEYEHTLDPEVFERMSFDPKIHKAKRIMINGALTDDLVFAPGATVEEAVSEAEYKKFANVAHFAERIIGGLEKPIWITLEQMLGQGKEQGHKIAEVTYEYRLDKPLRSVTTEKKNGPTRSRSLMTRMAQTFGLQTAQDETDSKPRGTNITKQPKTRLMPASIKVKPRGSVLFCVDEFMNILGLVPVWAATSMIVNPMNLVSRDKFLVFTNDPKDDDPRGQSSWRAVYNWWHFKTFIPKEYLRYLLQEAQPIPVMTLPPKLEGWLAQRDGNGNVINDPLTNQPKMVEAVVAAELTLTKMRGGKGVAIPAEAKLTPYKGDAGKGDVFPNALKTTDEQIEEGILLQPLAQSAGDVQSKSAASVHADVLGDLHFWHKRKLAVMILYDLIAVAVKLNLGDEALAYMPKLSLGDSEKRDWARDLEVVAKAYFYGFIDDSQRAELMAWLGLPRPGPSRQAMLAEVDPTTGEPRVPEKQRPDKQPGNKGRNDGNGKPEPNPTGPKQEMLEALTPKEGESVEQYAQRFRLAYEESKYDAVAKSHEQTFPSVGHFAGRGRHFVKFISGNRR
jgi:hypothetical protein